jgi:DNA-binding beta-propeller fold protein YncE
VTSPAGALAAANAVAVTADGAHLYVTSSVGNVVSHFRIDGAGNLTFAGCIGDLLGCTSTTPPNALDDADGVAVTADGVHLYTTSARNVVSHFRVDGAGNLIFAGCIGDLLGCTKTTPAAALDGARAVAVTTDGAHLYAISDTSDPYGYSNAAVSHFTIAGFLGPRHPR